MIYLNCFSLKISTQRNTRVTKMTDTQRFDVEEFDAKVASEIHNIHTITRMNEYKQKYFKWRDENLYHLETMFSLEFDPEEVDFDDFCYYVFENS